MTVTWQRPASCGGNSANCPEVAFVWSRPAHCDSNACPEVTLTPTAVGVRSSLDPSREAWFMPDEWRGLCMAIKAGEFEVPDGD